MWGEECISVLLKYTPLLFHFSQPLAKKEGKNKNQMFFWDCLGMTEVIKTKASLEGIIKSQAKGFRFKQQDWYVAVDIQQVLSSWILNKSFNKRDRKMALLKWILGCAVWKLHIYRYNFQSLGNPNCISTHILIERSPRVFSCFFLLHESNSLEGSIFHGHLRMGLQESFPPLNPLHIQLKRGEKQIWDHQVRPSEFLFPFNHGTSSRSHFTCPFTLSSDYWGGWS